MLTVYKASAGSGKTFRLAIEYIKQLIIAPNNYEHILAVTFTNKATEEMKMRILSQLYGLAHNFESSKAYMAVLMEDLSKQDITNRQIDEKFISERAGIALTRLLHNYSFFRVETIDKFFQSVLRNLARELDLTPSLRVELSAKEIEHRAVDAWIDSLKETDKELNWILDYVHSNIEEDKRWNVIEKIKTFGEQLLYDDYKTFSQELTHRLESQDKDFYKQYTSHLRNIIATATKEINAEGKMLWETIVNHGLDEDSFTQKKKGVGSFIRKMSTCNITELEPNTYVRNACSAEDTEATKWTSKSAPKAVKELCRDVLRPRFMKVMSRFDALICDARSAQVTLNHMSELRMLQAIQDEITRSNNEHDRFLLSDTQPLLSRMIDGSDSPFIFEKIGTRLQSIMIDEFQDTSRIQWRNFKVLLNDCMSHGHDNLIVGDVKQSIYRWRSGDWRLLNNIKDEFQQSINEQSLIVNRRSSSRIIDFNNAFFTHAAEKVYEEAKTGCKAEDAEMLKNAYKDVCQKYPEGKPHSGYVEIQLFDKDDYNTATLDYISQTISSLILQGVKQKDIAILVRNNRQISEIAQHCTQTFNQAEDPQLKDIRIVSDEGFLLKASHAVCIIVDAIRLLLNPDNNIVRARLSLMYQRNIMKSAKSQQEMLDIMLLPPEYSNNMQSLVTLPLYQLCEELYLMFDIATQENQAAYICYFFDCVSEYIKNSTGDIQAFIEQWDERLSTKSIESDSDNGIRIMTIHKSKGLEYGHVIIPFCDWMLELGGLLWCVPQKEPFNQLPIIPLDFSKKNLLNTIYEPAYWEEHMQNLVDNINLLYVAFTRAKDGLYITTQKGQKEGYRGQLVESIMHEIGEELGAMEEVVVTENMLQFGEISVKQKEEEYKSSEPNVFLQPSVPMRITVKTNTREPEFRESNRSKEFTTTDEQEDEQLQSQYIQLGNILHSLFASIHTESDIPAALLKLEMDGLLYGQDITAEMLQSHIDNAMQNPQIREWFSNRWRLYNECTILEYDTDNDCHMEHRPDRVMTDGNETIVVDFKLFSFKDSYRDQVHRYMELLRRMGHKNVRGYLWLVMNNKIIEIK